MRSLGVDSIVVMSKSSRRLVTLIPAGTRAVVLAVLGLLLLALMPRQVQAQPDPMLRIAVRADSAYVYHTKRLATGHGFNLYRKQGNSEYTKLNETLVRGIQRPGQLPTVVGDRYDWLEERYDEDSPVGVYYTMRGDWSNGLFAAFLDPSIARALGLLEVDQSAPVGKEVTYRVEFVDDRGEPTGETLTKTVTLDPTSAPAPDELAAEHEERQVTLSWQYPTTSREEDDKIIRFDVYRVIGEDRAVRENGTEVILRNSAETSFSYTFTVPQTGREETFFVAAVDIAGRAVALSDRLSYRITDNTPPAPVGGVRVFEGESNKAELTWSVHPGSDVAGYHVYRAPRLEAEFERINAERLPLLETTYVDSTVRGRHTYHYRVTAVDSAGNESDMSNAAMAQVVDQQPPPSPMNLAARTDSTAEGWTVDLTWSVSSIPSDLATFHVLRRRLGKSSGPTSYAQANADAVRDTAFVDDGVGKDGTFTEGAHYRYAVVAVDSARNESDTTFARIQIPDRTPPAPPSEVQAVNESGVRALVRWARSTELDVTRYRVYRQAGDGPDTLWTEVSSETHHLPDDRVEAGRTYEYTVSAVDSMGNEGPRSEPAVLEMRDYDPPATVRNVQAQARNDEGVFVRWEPVSADDVVGYRVYRTANIPTGIYEPVRDELVTGTEFTDPDGEHGMWYRVRAVDSSGNESPPSSPVQAVAPSAER